MAADRPHPAIYQVEVKNISVEGIRIPHIEDGELKPYASVRVGVNEEAAAANSRSISYVAGVYDDVNTAKKHRTCAKWKQTHLLSFNTTVRESKLYIDIINDRDSRFEHGSLIGSVCYELNDVHRVGGEPNRINRLLRRPGVADNGFIEFDVYVRSFEAEAANGNVDFGPVEMV